MPFETTRAVPREVKAMPASARKVWTAAFTKALGESPENLAEDLAYAAVHKVFKQENGKYVALKKGEDPQFNKGGPEPPTDPNEGLDPEDPDYDPDAAVEYETELATFEAEQEAAAEEDPEADPNADPEADPADPADPNAGGEEEDPEALAAAEKEAAAIEEPDPAAEAEAEAAQAEELALMAKAKAKFRAKARAKAQATTGDSSMQVTEFFALDAKSFRLTQDGYLVATPRVARTGIQLYRGSEVGAPDMDMVRVYRPETEVFDTRAMVSLAHRPITLEHPDTKVDSSNWRELSIGHSTGEVARDGDFIRVPLVLMDAHAIAAAQAGKQQLSVGYGAKLVWGAGQAPDGQLYDAVQSEIRANHIALVSAARGGDKLRIGDRKGRTTKRKGNNDDTQQRRKPMAERTMNLDGVTIELESRDAQVLERYIDNAFKKQKDQNAEVDALKAQIAELQAKLAEAMKRAGTTDGENLELKKQVEDNKLTADKLDQALEARMDVVDRAQSFFGDAAKYTWRGKSDAQIRRDVVAARHGDQVAKSMNDDAVGGAFLSLTDTEQKDGFKRMTESFSRPPVQHNDRAAAAYDKRNEELANRFKKNKKPFGATA